MIKHSPVWKGILIGVALTVAAGAVAFIVSRYLGVSDDIVLPIGTEVPGVTAWQTVTIGGVVNFEIPSTCTLDPGAGNAYVICPTEAIPDPIPEVHFSSDGMTVNVRRTAITSPYWDHVIASMSIVQPMMRDITINVEK